MGELKSFLKGKKPVTYVDLFAGAGGFSEGFLQSECNNKYFDFILASDINENCELTHKVRYNIQLGLRTKFITEDIMSPDFLKHLKEALNGKEVDVISGGPSCQSFSLSGRRRRFDKRDNLFDHYLKVIREIKPKYFIMENVKGILTKDKGRFKEEIMKEMRSIFDDNEVGNFTEYLRRLLSGKNASFINNALFYKIMIELEKDDNIAKEYVNLFFENIDTQFKNITRQVNYIVSKSDRNINTIRHGLSLLRRKEQRDRISSEIINEKTFSNIDNDEYVERINEFLSIFSDDEIIKIIIESIDKIKEFDSINNKDIEQLKKAISLYSISLDECFQELEKLQKDKKSEKELNALMAKLRLYNIHQMILVSSDYGVPQNRERVVYIGSRKDQKEILSVPATVSENEKVTVYEALHDLDFIGNGETKKSYEKVKKDRKLDKLIRKRTVEGKISTNGKSYAEWSREGRLRDRFNFDINPFYVHDLNELKNKQNWEFEELFNHQTSSQNDTVRKRLQVIAKYGGYTDECKKRLKELGLESAKRNYFVLNPEKQSPTVVTMPDDFIHYSQNRALTVREMARLQSFDDSFVFQGKRQTGGDKRKNEIPQYTLVGNAVPPLMSRAIGNEILKNIK